MSPIERMVQRLENLGRLHDKAADAAVRVSTSEPDEQPRASNGALACFVFDEVSRESAWRIDIIEKALSMEEAESLADVDALLRVAQHQVVRLADCEYSDDERHDITLTLRRSLFAAIRGLRRHTNGYPESVPQARQHWGIDGNDNQPWRELASDAERLADGILSGPASAA